MTTSLTGLPSHELLARLHELVRKGNRVEAELLAHLGEVDARRLYVEEACSSMFHYCQRVLHFPEAVAYKRIQAARAARRHPTLLEALQRGELHVTAISLLAPRLTAGNCRELIQAARHRSADEIRRLLADREPKPSVPASVRRLPEPSTGSQAGPPRAPAAAASSQVEPAPAPAAPGSSAPARSAAGPDLRARTEPLGGERYRVQFTADRELHAQLQELRALMRHRIPDGDLGKILAQAVSLLLEQVRQRKFGECSSPRPAKAHGERPSRHIPAAIRRVVARRDGERCSYVSSGGRRCEAREFLEFHHEAAWARTKTHAIEGITLRCRAHNQHAARRDFGERHMARFRQRRESRADRHRVPAPTPSPQQDPGPGQLDLDPVDRTSSPARKRPGGS